MVALMVYLWAAKRAAWMAEMSVVQKAEKTVGMRVEKTAETMVGLLVVKKVGT